MRFWIAFVAVGADPSDSTVALEAPAVGLAGFYAVHARSVRDQRIPLEVVADGFIEGAAVDAYELFVSGAVSHHTPAGAAWIGGALV